jgi:hypothetical protein
VGVRFGLGGLLGERGSCVAEEVGNKTVKALALKGRLKCLNKLNFALRAACILLLLELERYDNRPHHI